MNFEVNDIPSILGGHTDIRWPSTIYNFYNTMHEFMDDVDANINHKDNSSGSKAYHKEGQRKYKEILSYNIEYDKVYQEIAMRVRDKLVGRGFTTKMLYGNVEFTSRKTGSMSKQRALLGRRDCYFSNPTMDDGKLFFDFYINLSYSAGISNEHIKRNAYALYALTATLGRLLSLRVIVVNHVGSYKPTCYSYILKKFGQSISPREFLFGISDIKRTYGWSSYDLLNNGNGGGATVGQPENTVSIADFSLDKEIDNVWEFFKARKL